MTTLEQSKPADEANSASAAKRGCVVLQRFVSRPERPMLRYFGGKWRIGKWICDKMPNHRTYVESFGGGGSVLLQKTPAEVEIYNDLDGEIVNLFRVIRDSGEQLIRALKLTPYAREEFESAREQTGNPIEDARRTLVRCHMGFGVKLTTLTSDKTRTQIGGFRDYAKDRQMAADWKNWPDFVPAMIDRLKNVIIEKRNALDVIVKHDSATTLHYVDPPYVHSTRKEINKYRFEMSDEDHRKLAAVLNNVKGSVILSGYACPLYDDELFAGWKRMTTEDFTDNQKPRTEVIWLRNVQTHGMLPGLDG